MANNYDSLFEPLEVGGILLRNRTAMTTHGPRLPQGRYLTYLEERAAGGVALVIVPCVAALYRQSTYPAEVRTPESSWGDEDSVNPASGDPWHDQVVPVLRAQGEAIRLGGAVAFAQLNNPGANRHNDNYQPAVAPSEVLGDHPPNVPHVLDLGEIASWVRAYGDDARRVQEAGLSGVEIHSAHGYLISQFLSPEHNRRGDGYGGSPERRARFLNEVIDEIRRQTSPGFVIGLRLSANEEAPAIARLVADRIAYISVSRGSFDGMQTGRPLVPYVAPWMVGEPPVLPYAKAVKQAVSIPVLAAGRIATPALARRVVAEGIADLVGFTRALIADPRFVEKLRSGRDREVNLCIGCNECHRGRAVTCTVNPAAGREEELAPALSPNPGRVAVVGGGPAGMQAAIAAAGRGHSVALYERRQRLGGALDVVTQDPSRAAWRSLVDQQERQLQAAGVEVRLGVEVGPDELQGADHVIVATGGREVSRDGQLTSWAVLSGAAQPRGRVIVASGRDEGLDGPLTALLLAARGCTITLSAEGLAIGEGLEQGVRHVVLRRLLEARVRLAPMTRVRGGSLVNVLTGRRRAHRAIVVWAAGRHADRDLYDRLLADGRRVVAVGDALAPRRLVHAVLDGTRIGASL